MPTVDLEAAIAEFLAMGRRLQGSPPVTGERVLEELMAWYRDSRVQGALMDEDGDMLLLQWGATRPLVVPEPVDLRKIDDSELEIAGETVKYIDFARQVFVAEDEEAEEFDDGAVQMSITLGFEPADGHERGSNLWVPTPEDLEKGIAEFVRTAFVKERLNRPAESVAITVGYCG